MGDPGCFQIISDVLEKGRHDFSTSLIRNVSISRSSPKHNLSTDKLMVYSRADPHLGIINLINDFWPLFPFYTP